MPHGEGLSRNAANVSDNGLCSPVDGLGDGEILPLFLFMNEVVADSAKDDSLFDLFGEDQLEPNPAGQGISPDDFHQLFGNQRLDNRCGELGIQSTSFGKITDGERVGLLAKAGADSIEPVENGLFCEGEILQQVVTDVVGNQVGPPTVGHNPLMIQKLHHETACIGSWCLQRLGIGVRLSTVLLKIADRSLLTGLSFTRDFNLLEVVA